MVDDPNRRGAADRSRVNVHEDYELSYWSAKWGVTREQLKAAVARVGPLAKDVAAELGKDE